jgi:hypothetical protein
MVASVDDPRASGGLQQRDAVDSQFLTTRTLIIMSVSAMVALAVGVSAGISMALALPSPTTGIVRVVVGLSAGLGAATMAGFGLAATLHSLIDKRR